MVAILAIIAALLVVAVVAGVRSRRRAEERARVERERELLAGQLGGTRGDREARFRRAESPDRPRPRIDQLEWRR